MESGGETGLMQKRKAGIAVRGEMFVSDTEDSKNCHNVNSSAYLVLGSGGRACKPNVDKSPPNSVP